MQKRLKFGAIAEEIAILTGALAIIAAAVYFFLVPSQTSISSISGLAIVLANFVPLPLSAITMILNVVLLIIGFFTCGREFGAKTVYTSLLLPVFLAVLERLFPNCGSLTGSQELDVLCYILHRAEHSVQPQRLLRRAGHCGQNHEQVPAHGAWQGHVALRYVRGPFSRAGVRQEVRGFERAGNLFQRHCAGPLYF